MLDYVFLSQLGIRPIYLTAGLLAGAGWVGVALAPSLPLILASRLLAGTLFGVFQANTAAYIAEISQPALRGSLAVMLGPLYSLGCLYTYLTDWLAEDWRTTAWLQLLSVALMAAAVRMPESPHWLVQRGREEEALAALIQLRGPRYDAKQELAEIVASKKAFGDDVGLLGKLCSRVFLLPFLRIGVLLLLCEWAGTRVVEAFLEVILLESHTSLVEVGSWPVVVAGVQLAASLVSTLLLRICPRKPLFLSSTGGMTVALAGLAAHLQLAGPAWLPLACLLLHSACKVTL